MALTQEDLQAIESLIALGNSNLREELMSELNPRFDAIAEQLDGLYKRDETREQEYLALGQQLDRLEKKCA